MVGLLRWSRPINGPAFLIAFAALAVALTLCEVGLLKIGVPTRFRSGWLLRSARRDDGVDTVDGGDHSGDGSHSPPSALLPDWRIASDCSAYALDCPSRRRGRYGSYPFRVRESFRQAGVDGTYDWTVLRDGLPDGWRRSLREYAPPPLPEEEEGKGKGEGAEAEAEAKTTRADRGDGLILPPRVSRAQAEACVESASTRPFDEQLDSTLSRLTPDIDLNMIAFTISDRKYSSDMLHEVWEMNRDIVGFVGAFFFLALDAFTVDMACEYGYPVVAWPSEEGGRSGSGKDEEGKEKEKEGGDGDKSGSGGLKGRVQNSKMEVSRSLVERDRSFFFFEMDVWFIKSPKPMLSHQSADLMISSHQNIPFGGNIGAYAVRANDATRSYFRDCSDMIRLSPNTHDQVVMNDLAWANEAALRGHKFNGDMGRWEEPRPQMPNITHPMSKEYFGPHTIVACYHPVPTEKTLAVHPLSTAPLKEPHGKKMLAKELGVWTGYRGRDEDGGGYYRRTGARRRYLLLDGRVLVGYSSVQDSVYHSSVHLRWTVAALVALARQTGRILVLPRLVGDYHVHFLWTYLDLKAVEEMGVAVRETNFLSDRRSWYNATHPFRTVARTALYDGGRLFAQVPPDTDTGGLGGNASSVRAWKIPTTNVTAAGDPVDALFGISTALEEVRGAEALLVNPAFIRGGYETELMLQRVPMKRAGVAELEIRGVYERLRWCGRDFNLGLTVSKVGSTSDCYGLGQAVDRTKV